MCCGEAVTDRVILPEGTSKDFAGGAAVDSADAPTRQELSCGL